MKELFEIGFLHFQIETFASRFTITAPVAAGALENGVSDVSISLRMHYLGNQTSLDIRRWFGPPSCSQFTLRNELGSDSLDTPSGTDFESTVMSGSGQDINSRPTLRNEKKMGMLRSWYRRHRGKVVIFFEDETDLLLFPPLRSAWAPRGKPNRIWISGKNAKRVVFGAINLATGHHVELQRPKRRSEDFCAFLLELRRHYRKQNRLALILDQDPGHCAEKSRKLADQLRIELHWLPVRSPELNPMETLWGHAKPRVCANRQYKTIGHEAKKFMRFLKRLSPTAARCITGLRSDDFWLFN